MNGIKGGPASTTEVGRPTYHQQVQHTAMARIQNNNDADSVNNQKRYAAFENGMGIMKVYMIYMWFASVNNSRID